MAVAKARELHPIERATFDIDHRALVIGGGLAGMTAALSIAEQGFGVTLVEREAALGGNLRHIYTALPGSEDGDPQALLKRMIGAVSARPRISVLTGAEVVDVGGYLGQYRTTLKLADGRQEEVHHGVMVVATGSPEGNGQAHTVVHMRHAPRCEFLHGERVAQIPRRVGAAPASFPGRRRCPCSLVRSAPNAARCSRLVLAKCASAPLRRKPSFGAPSPGASWARSFAGKW